MIRAARVAAGAGISRGGRARWSILTRMLRPAVPPPLPLTLLRAAHPKQTLATAVGLAAAAGVIGRPTEEVGLVFVTVLVGQALLGWHNDVVDRHRDSKHDRPRKPLAQQHADPGTLVFAIFCALLALVPLAVANGVTAGACYLGSVLIGLLSNVAFRAGPLSWLPWAASYALYPAFLSFGGYAGEGTDTPPTVLMTVLVALLGVCVHVLTALPGLVHDNQDQIRSLPLRIALRIGATPLLVASLVATAAVVVGIVLAGQTVGLRQ